MKYIAKQIPFDMQVSNFDYSRNEDNYIIYGNKEFLKCTNDLFDHALSVLDYGYLHEDIDNLPYTANFTEYRNIIESYFPIVYHDKTQYRETDYTDNEIDIIRHIVKQYDYSGKSNQRDLIAQFLTVLTGKQYEHREIHGTVQGEWNVIYYPVNDYADDQIRFIEIEYFNTGSEFEVYRENDIDNSEFVYIHDYYNDDEIKNELTKYYIDCSVNDIEIHHFTGYTQIPMYD